MPLVGHYDAALDDLRVGGTFYVDGKQNYAEVAAACGRWGKANRCMLDVRVEEDGVRVELVSAERGGPKNPIVVKFRKEKPWHGLALREVLVLKLADHPNAQSIRNQVSQYGKRVGRKHSVEIVKTKIKITRIE